MIVIFQPPISRINNYREFWMQLIDYQFFRLLFDRKIMRKHERSIILGIQLSKNFTRAINFEYDKTNRDFH